MRTPVHVVGTMLLPNRRLLRIVGAPEEDWPTGVKDTYACLHVDLPSTIRDELPPNVFDELLTNVASEYGVKRKGADKNPTVLHALIREAARSGHPIPTLEAIADRIVTAAVNLAPRREHPDVRKVVRRSGPNRSSRLSIPLVKCSPLRLRGLPDGYFYRVTRYADVVRERAFAESVL